MLTVYDGKRVRIRHDGCRHGVGERFDHAAFVEDVGKLGIDAKRLARLARVKRHTISLRPAHVFLDVSGYVRRP